MTNLNQETLEISDIIAHVNRAVDLIEAGRDPAITVDFLKRLARMLETQEELIDTELFAEYEEEEVIDAELLLPYEESEEDKEDREIKEMFGG